MSDKSNKYGYVGVDIPEQSFGNNKGIFNPAEINELVADNKWTKLGYLELIETITLSDVSSAIFTDIKKDKYDVHFMTVNNFIASNDSEQLRVRFYESGVEQSGSIYHYSYTYGSSGAVAFGDSRSTGYSALSLSATTGNQPREVGNSVSYFYNLGNSGRYSSQTTINTNIRLDGSYIMSYGVGQLPQTSIVDQLKVLVLNGTCSADVSLYGVNNGR